jgi:hypothetical protein
MKSLSPRLETLSINSPIPVCVTDAHSVSENYSIPIRGEIVEPCRVIGARRHADSICTVGELQAFGSLGMWAQDYIPPYAVLTSPQGTVSRIRFFCSSNFKDKADARKLHKSMNFLLTSL